MRLFKVIISILLVLFTCLTYSFYLGYVDAREKQKFVNYHTLNPHLHPEYEKENNGIFTESDIGPLTLCFVILLIFLINYEEINKFLKP